ncbi:sigma factor [Nonomuraea roseola]|uniref:Sigma factor n=1 Tax=Nonomuraea roseola TaxID=46179 RepID=A0ABV5Q3Q0_9ACTN
MDDGFTEYVAHRYLGLCRMAYLLARDWGTAEDLVQTALAKAWVAWRRIEGNPDPYVYRIIVNTHASWWRRRWRGEVPAERVPAGPPGPGETSVAQRPVDSAQVEPGPKLPERFPVVLGAVKFDLSLIDSQRFETMGVARTVTFTPTSLSTGHTVVCDDPQAWVVIRGKLKGGEMGGSAGRCGESVGGHHDRLSAPSGWLKRPQSLQVWVFPADAPVREVAEAVTGCRPLVKSKGCDETALSRELMNPEVRERLSAKVGEVPGRWAVGIYDRPGKGKPAPTGDPLTEAEPPASTPAG